MVTHLQIAKNYPTCPNLFDDADFHLSESRERPIASFLPQGGVSLSEKYITESIVPLSFTSIEI